MIKTENTVKDKVTDVRCKTAFRLRRFGSSHEGR